MIVSLFLLPLLLNAQQPPADDLRITTKSEKARAYFAEGLARYQTLHLEDGYQNWRKAAKEDPDFALAHTFLFVFAQDPAEQLAEREKALTARQFASPEEQLVIDWMSHSSQGNWIAAIQEMNEAKEKYSGHKQVLWLAANWLTQQQQWGRATPVYERLTRLDPGFADAWNSLAYCYARTRQFDRAFAAMDRYTKLLPTEPNPQDSFAEISRMAGRFGDALEHYHASLKIDPSFIDSQLGIADTYALMGDQGRARAEYALAIKQARSKIESVNWSMQAAATYVREGDYAGADAAFEGVATQAHANGFGHLEAEAHRAMALYKKGRAALDAVMQAELLIHEPYPVPKAVLDQELAVVLRTAVEVASQEGNPLLASASLKKLEALANSSQNSAVLQTYDDAAGALALTQGNYDEAIARLQEDDRNPYSLQRLMIAYEKSKRKKEAARVAEKLAAFNEPTIEQAVIVPAFRKGGANGIARK